MQSKGHSCVHEDMLRKAPELKRIPRIAQQYPPKPRQAQTQQVAYKPLRITFHNETLIAENTLTADRLALLQSLYLPTVQSTVAQMVSVVPIVGNLKVPLQTCGANGGVTVPAAYKTSGIANTDLAIFLTARTSTGGELAWAITCLSDQSGRPVAAQVNINPSLFFSNTYSTTVKQGALLHEIVHALGFSSSLFQYYKDENGALRSQVTTTETLSTGKNITKIVTPNALRAAREHFYCSSLNGVQLEDQGTSTSAGSHWDTKYYMDELMVAAAYWDNPGVSNLTHHCKSNTLLTVTCC